MPLSIAELNAFTEEVLQIRDHTNCSLSAEDFRHLKKVIWINRLLLVIGFGTAWIQPNPVSMIAISLALTAMWTIVAHHALHGGYDTLGSIAKRYHSDRFARGSRRFIDWPDWIYPPAWDFEHNKLHHYFVNEMLDPDQMSYRLAAKTSALSKDKTRWQKLVRILVKISFWKCSYYAFNTMKAFIERKDYRQDGNFKNYTAMTLRHSIIPYLLYHFVLIPALFLPLGWHAYWCVLINRLGAEIITNWHTFMIIVTNHTGSDLSLQDKHFSHKGEYFLAQLTSSCNFNTGGFWRDYLQGYLNYQIEHHFFPHIPPSQFPKLQPQIKSLCFKYQLPYIQEPLFMRVKKLFNIMLQKEVMQANVTKPLLEQEVSESYSPDSDEQIIPNS